MHRLVLVSFAAVLLALPGCELFGSSSSATVTVRQADTAPACCPMEGTDGAMAADVAVDPTGDCGECPTTASKAECVPSDCDMPRDCETECEIEEPCEAPCEKDGDTQQ